MSATGNDPQSVRPLSTLVGVSAAALVSMLWLSDGTSEYGRTDIGTSLCLALVGGVIGNGVGTLALWTARSPKGVWWVAAVAILSLTCSLGAVLGWLVGDGQAKNRFEHRERTRHAALIGAGIGLIIGIAIRAHPSGRLPANSSRQPLLNETGPCSPN